jgi:hypothetical protein
VLAEGFPGVGFDNRESTQTRRHVTALSPLQQRVMALLDLTPTSSTKLCGDSPVPRENERTVSQSLFGILKKPWCGLSRLLQRIKTSCTLSSKYWLYFFITIVISDLKEMEKDGRGNIVKSFLLVFNVGAFLYFCIKICLESSFLVT